jgi:hypothetical protein
MIPKVHNWKVTFYRADGTSFSTIVTCVKRFAKGIAIEALGRPAYSKVTVGLVKA